jgi:hypothetical protein
VSLRNQFPAALAALSTAKSTFLLYPESAWPTRELGYWKAFEAMMGGHLTQAVQRLEEVMTEYPTDLFALKKLQLLYFLLGDRAGMVSVAQRPAVASACSHLKYYHSFVAFALEENDDMVGARKAAERALELEPNDPWAIHDLAHVLFAEADFVEGANWLESKESVWSECMSFLFTHCNFHVALLRLDGEEYSEVKRILDEKIWPVDGTKTAASTSSTSFGLPLTSLSFPIHDPEYPEDQNAALNLLLRFEVRRTTRLQEGAASKHEATGKDYFDARWKSVSTHLRLPLPQLTSLYGLLQMYCLFRVGRTEDAQQSHAAMRDAVSKLEAGSDQRRKLEAILLPIAQAMEHQWNSGGKEGARKAVECVQEVLGTRKPSPEAQSDSSASLPSSPPPPLSLPPHLSCLSASGEQLEVLSEWYLMLCVEAGATEEVRRVFEGKPDVRKRKVEWYGRMLEAERASAT